MKIAQILYHTCPLASEEGKESGGANVYVLKLSEELAKKGIRVDMFTRSEDEKTKKIIELNKNLRLIHLKAGPEKTLPKKSLIEFIPEFVENMIKFVVTNQWPVTTTKNQNVSPFPYSILDCHYFMSGLTALELEKQVINVVTGHWPVTATKKIITFHTLGLIKNLVARSPSETAGETRIQEEQKLVQKSDAIIAPSKNEADYLHFLYGADKNKIKIISPGYDPTIFKSIDKISAKKRIGACQDHKIILFVGRIEPLKGIDSLLFATKIAFEKYKTQFCVFIIGGEKNTDPQKTSNTMKKLNDLRGKLNLHTSVKFISQVSQHELVNFYNAADVVVMPSHYESFGMAALEAMACETPVIVTETAGISGVLENNHKSIIISAGNPLLLAEKINHILKNEKYHQKLSEEIKKTINNLTWSKTAEEIIKIYSGLIKS